MSSVSNSEALKTTIRFVEVSEQKSKDMSESIARIVGLVPIREVGKLINILNLDANPRESKSGKITDAIIDTIEKSPELFPFKSKGILLASARYKALERKRYELNFKNRNVEGILDGGHNSLSIGLHILRQAGVPAKEIRKAKTWSQFKEVWHAHNDEVLEALGNKDIDSFNTLVPVEILIPTDPEDELRSKAFSESLLEICAARNNNAELKAEARLNRAGYFDFIKDSLPQELSTEVQWKTNESGRIKVTDIVALAWLPLMKLDQEITPKFETPSEANLYASKAACLTKFEKLMATEGITVATETGIDEREVDVELVDENVKSALALTGDFAKLYDHIVLLFPRLYNASGGKLGKIAAIESENKSDKQKYAKFSGDPIDKQIPEGFIYPLLFSLTALLEVDNVGNISWKTNPWEFIEDRFLDVMNNFRNMVLTVQNNDPQKVGKSVGSYQTMYQSVENILFRMK